MVFGQFNENFEWVTDIEYTFLQFMLVEDLLYRIKRAKPSNRSIEIKNHTHRGGNKRGAGRYRIVRSTTPSPKSDGVT